MTRKNKKMEKTVPMMKNDDLTKTVFKELRNSGIKTLNSLECETSYGMVAFDLTDKGRAAYIELLKKELATAVKITPHISSSTDLGTYLSEKYVDLDHEEMHVISLNADGDVLSDDCVASGSNTKAVVSISRVARIAVMNNAVTCVLCHNHPSGNLMPSNFDLKTTQATKKALEFFGINLIDHFIVGNAKYYSFAENGDL